MTLSTDERDAFARTWGAVLHQLLQDDEFAGRLHADPRTTLVGAGLELREGAIVLLETVATDGPDLDRQVELYAAGRAGGIYTFLLPVAPLAIQELSEHELDGVAAGACAAAHFMPPTLGS